ncbi:hypothetical protein H4S00_006751, partial [Coemansia sp. D1744]
MAAQGLAEPGQGTAARGLATAEPAVLELGTVAQGRGRVVRELEKAVLAAREQKKSLDMAEPVAQEQGRVVREQVMAVQEQGTAELVAQGLARAAQGRGTAEP